ncbi:MAG: hypothetical protein AAGI68_09285 [Planctomycetota bacterium]
MPPPSPPRPPPPAAVVTTEKDWVKWAELLEGEELGVPVLRPVLSMRFVSGEDGLEQRLRGLLG